MVVLWGIVVPHIAHASFCDTVDSEAARMCHNDRSVFNHGEKRRKPGSLPSFVSYVDVEPYAVSRLQHNYI